MPEKEAEGRISTLKKNKSVTEKKRIEQIDDVFVDLSLKIRELSEKEITAKVRRKLLGNVDLENLPKLVAEINGIWAGKRKITVSKAVLPEGNSILQQVLYQEMDRRNAEKNARGDAVRPEVEACVPLEVKLE